MANDVLYEVCVEDVDGACAAERGGAQRVELCAGLAFGGTTPSVGAMTTARRALGIPIVALVRPRSGDFVVSGADFDVMRADIGAAREAELDGVALGILTRGGELDVERMRALIELARPLDVVLHRAFDRTPSLERALETAIELGVDRILTSGGARDAEAGIEPLRGLVERAGDRIGILAGGGVRAHNAARIARATGVREIHGRAPAPAESAAGDVEFVATDEGSVRAVVRSLRG